MARSKRWKRFRAPIAVGVLVAVAGTAYAVSRPSDETSATTRYVTEAAQTGTLSVTVSGTGNLEVRDEVEVYPSTAGTVASVKVEEGDRVEKGDVLIVLDDDEAADGKTQALSSVRQAEESLAKARLTLAQAKASLASLEDKAAEQEEAADETQTQQTAAETVTDADIDNAEAQIDIAEMGVTSAKTNLATARAEYSEALDAFDELEIVAPCDGVVWSLDAATGDSLTAKTQSSSSSASSGTGAATGAATGADAASSASSSSSSASSAPVTVARDGELALKVTVGETDVCSVKAGQAAELTFDAIPDLTISGKVDEVSRTGTVSSGVVTYDLWVALDVTDERLKTGMSSTAVVITEVVRDALLVPNAAVKSDDTNGDYVLVMSDGAEEPRSVQVTCGPANATNTVVTEGLTAGDKVVTQTVDSSDTESETNAGGGFMMGGPGMGGR